jgi:hypothetical protein
MRTIVLAAFLNFFVAVGFIAIAIPAHAAKAAAPCEDMLKSMRQAKASAQLTPADKQKVDTLEAKAVERCNADDDARSDAFLAEAMKVMGK